MDTLTDDDSRLATGAPSGAPAPEPPRWDARPGSRLRGLLVTPLWLLFAFGVLAPLAPVVIFAPHLMRRWRLAITHFWGRGLLALLGVRLVVEGREHLPEHGPAIVLFTHQSLLDLALLSALWPPRGIVLYKQEFHRIPFMGSTMRAMGFIAVDRQNREAAVRSVREAADAIREQNAQVLIAPEGTRSRTRGLLRFKRGPFHLALASRAPMVPVIFQGVRQVMPAGHWIGRPGTVRALYLPTIDTSDWRADSIDQHVADVRAMFLAHVPDATAS